MTFKTVRALVCSHMINCDMNNVALKIPVSIPLVDFCNGLLLASLSYHQMRQLKQPLLELTVNAQNEDSYPLAQMFHFYLSKEGFVVIGVIVRVWLACVASVSNRVIARTLEREQKKKMGGGGGWEKRKRLPATPSILENAP